MSQFIVSARKYRPQKFNELLGQNHVATTLKNALSNNQLAHAFLFCGPRGVGKTSCARILAKVLNCENLQNQVDPCGECSSCKSFNNNASFNIIELDAASNNSVEHIRNLIEQVRFQPQQGTHKVFIIDEVHMLSSQAFNAFLKTLEEPPPYAVFILATTEKHKILPTILSRCQIFDFKRIQTEDIISQLKNISTKEEIKYDLEALNIIAQKSDGAMRDALSIFDKVVSTTDREITYDEVIDSLNILDYDYYFRLTDALLQEDISNVILILDDIMKRGFDVELCLLGLAEHFRELLMSKNTSTLSLITSGENLKKRYLNQGQLCTHSFIMSGLSILNTADINFQKAKNKRLHAEISLSKINYLNRQKTIEEPLRDVSKVVASSEKPSPAKEPVKSTPPAATPEVKVMQKTTQATVSIKKIPTIGFSSEADILSKIKEEEKQKEIRPKKLNLGIINEVWKKYVENQSSITIKTSLKNKEIEISDKLIKVFLPSPNALNTLVSEDNLLQEIRDSFDIEGLVIEPSLSAERFPEYQKFSPKQVLSPKEKYNILLDKNPALKELKDKFDLKVDS
jgi:DNA polymerase-3 subunit gamma/tau